MNVPTIVQILGWAAVIALYVAAIRALRGADSPERCRRAWALMLPAGVLLLSLCIWNSVARRTWGHLLLVVPVAVLQAVAFAARPEEQTGDTETAPEEARR